MGSKKLISKPKHPFSLPQIAPCEDRDSIPSLSCHMAHSNIYQGPWPPEHPAATACPTSPSPPWTRVPFTNAIAAGKTELARCRGKVLVTSTNVPLCQVDGGNWPLASLTMLPRPRWAPLLPHPAPTLSFYNMQQFKDTCSKKTLKQPEQVKQTQQVNNFLQGAEHQRTHSLIIPLKYDPLALPITARRFFSPPYM